MNSTIATRAELLAFADEKPTSINDDLYAWANEAAAYLRQCAELEERLIECDQTLSRVLHELAGAASLCWWPNPAGVFDTEQAIDFTTKAIEELRSILRGPKA